MYSFGIVLALILGAEAALKDGPGNGLSKTTYSSNNPFIGLEFMLEYLPASDASDSCGGDVCKCTVDDTEYDVNQGRAQLNTNSKFGVGLSEDPMPMVSGFGMHLVNCSMSSVGGQMTTHEVEQQFTTKLGNMTEYDSFMDYNFALYTPNLDSYVSKFTNGNVPYLSVQWELPTQAAAPESTAGGFLDDDSSSSYTQYYGVMVHVPGTQMVIEIMSADSSAAHSDASKVVTLEQRASHSAIRSAIDRIKAHRNGDKTAAKAGLILGGNNSSEILSIVAINRATSKLSDVETFYIDGMQITESMEVSNEDVQKKCFIWEVFGAESDVCFTQRSDSATKGDFKVSDFENMLITAHTNVIKSGSCNDKWMDNHYAVDEDPSSATPGYADYIIDYIDERDDVFFYCEGSTLHYLTDPTGWGIQLDVTFTKAPSACPQGPPPGPPHATGFGDDGDLCPCTLVTTCGYGDVSATDNEP